jgi:N-acetylmuramoyl-L-alanine amidase
MKSLLTQRLPTYLGLLLALSAIIPAVFAMPLIALDVGHSWRKPGAFSARGVPEFAFNRALTESVAKILQKQGFRVRVNGIDGALDDLRTRPRLANGADFLLSIHHDSVQPQYLKPWTVDGTIRRYSDRFSGFSLFVSRRNPRFEQSLACASALGAALRAVGFTPSTHHAEPIPGENRRFTDQENGVHEFDDLVVLRAANQPAVLFEAGIIVNRTDELKLRQPATQARIAAALAAGLSRCLMVVGP